VTRAAFIDKDGTLVVDVPYNADPARVRLHDGAAEGLRMLAAAGFRLFVVSNQSGVARGYFGMADVARMEEHLRAILSAEGVTIEAFYWCPHHPDGVDGRFAVPCTCRKPEPGMLLRAAAEHGIDLASSWVIGDILDDVDAGRRAGCLTVLVDNGGETEWVMPPRRTPHYVAGDLADAARHIVRSSRPPRPAHRGNAYG
jgi:D-glycero-D-manno-heptose 1,7-bisphosphate phosphatase